MTVIVWDFDGVLNANVVAGRFVWADNLRRDWGIDPAAFSAQLFARNRFGPVICGEVDLRDAVTDVLTELGHDIDPDAFLAYWFARDARPDADVIRHLAIPGKRHVIGTNNEARRAAYIEGQMGFGARVERIFASGRMGVAKPDPAYFRQIADWSGEAMANHALIDDHAPNVAAARTLGWKAFHFTEATRDGLPDFLDSLT